MTKQQEFSSQRVAHAPGRRTRFIGPPGTVGFGAHHARRSAGHASEAGGQLPPFFTDRISSTVRGQSDRFSTPSARTKTSSSSRTPPLPRNASTRSRFKKRRRPGPPTTPKSPQNRKRNQPRPRLMDTSRLDGVKPPDHRWAPRYDAPSWRGSSTASGTSRTRVPRRCYWWRWTRSSGRRVTKSVCELIIDRRSANFRPRPRRRRALALLLRTTSRSLRSPSRRPRRAPPRTRRVPPARARSCRS